MLFNFGKCNCLHTGHGNLDVNYKIGETVLGTTVKEKELGITKRNYILGLIRRNLINKETS